MNAETEAALVLLSLPDLSYAGLYQLYRRFGSFQGILAADPSGLPPDYQAAIRPYQGAVAAHHAAAGQQFAQLQATGTELLTLSDERYPRLLREIARPPLLIYVRGNVSALALPQIAVVGSRQSSPAGAATAADFAKVLAASGFAITSGLALGIDGAAHRGALVTGVTIAVLGSGLDQIYPRQHRALADAIVAAGGALVSEFSLGTPPLAKNFPRRNRVISGLSLGVVVVEAAPRSGSLITARLAMEQGREVFAIPGSIHNPQARGCHQLLREGATLVETAADIVEQLGGLLAYKDCEASAPPTPAYSEEEESVLRQLGFDPLDLDTLVARTGMTASLLSRVLVNLELQVAIASHNGRFSRVR